MKDHSNFIKKFLSGDTKTLNNLYTHNFYSVEKYILSNGGTSTDCKDIFQSALTIIYVKLKNQPESIKNFDNYLFTVCKNLWKRENVKKRVTNLDTITLESKEIDLASFYLEQQQWELYQETFKKLSKGCQEILKMIFNNKTYKEIVSYFSYSSQTVARQRVFKCKAKLIQLIKKDKRYFKLK